MRATVIRTAIVLIGILVLTAVATMRLLKPSQNYARRERTNQPVKLTSTPYFSPTPDPTATPAPTNTLIPTKPPAVNKIIFGVGSQAGSAMDYRLVKEAPVHMLTSWYNGTKDLEWMRIQQNDLIPRLYANKYIVHLITWTDLPEETIQTAYGTACGRPYPVSDQVVEDMKQLAQIYNGNGPMYVTLFTEFQTYTCTDNNWIGNENYYNALKDNFRKIKNIFHQYAPRSKVALSWGGWQSTYDNPVNKGGRSLFPYFADVIKESDFAAFQAMESDTNITEILDMTRILGAYGKPVMAAHYKPANDSQAVFDADMSQLFTDEVMLELIKNGLFAFSFMDYNQIGNSEASFQTVKAGIQKYGN